MKDMMIDIMVTMMPIMKPFMWFSVVVAITGFIFIIANVVFKLNNVKAVKWTSGIVLAASVFFLMAQVAGYFLNMPPTINFGDSSKFEFILVNFWEVGVGFLVVGIVMKLSGKLNRVA